MPIMLTHIHTDMRARETSYYAQSTVLKRFSVRALRNRRVIFFAIKRNSNHKQPKWIIFLPISFLSLSAETKSCKKRNFMFFGILIFFCCFCLEVRNQISISGPYMVLMVLIVSSPIAWAFYNVLLCFCFEISLSTRD